MAIRTTPAIERSEYRPLYGPSPRRATSPALGSRAIEKAWVPRKSTRPRMRSAIASVLRNAPSTYPGDDRKVSAAKLGHGEMRVLAAAIVLALAAVVGGQAVAAEPPLVALTLVGPREVVFASTKECLRRSRRPGRAGAGVSGRQGRGRAFRDALPEPRLARRKLRQAEARLPDRAGLVGQGRSRGLRRQELDHGDLDRGWSPGRGAPPPRVPGEPPCRPVQGQGISRLLVQHRAGGRLERRRRELPAAENSAGRRRRALPPGGRSTPAPRLLQPLEHRSRRGPALHVRGDDRLAWPAERRLPLPHLRRRRCVGLARLGRRAVLGALRRSLPQPRKAGPRLPPDRTLPGAGRRGGAASPERRLGRGLPGRRRWRPLQGARPLLRGLARPPRVGQAAAASRRQDPLRQLVRCERVHRLPVAPRSRGQGRNFDDVGDAAELYFATLRIEGCTVTSDRNLVRRKVAIKVWP